MAVVGGLAAAFDDTKVAQLLATAMALDGQASDRLATIFNTIAPDEDRKRRVLSLTRTMLSETDFGRSGQFQVLWASAEELLISYNDKPFVSEAYRSALDGVGGRAERMAVVDLPPELGDWLDTLGQDSVRTLSVTMLIDLLNLARDAPQAEEHRRRPGGARRGPAAGRRLRRRRDGHRRAGGSRARGPARSAATPAARRSTGSANRRRCARRRRSPATSTRRPGRRSAR